MWQLLTGNGSNNFPSTKNMQLSISLEKRTKALEFSKLVICSFFGSRVATDMVKRQYSDTLFLLSIETI